MREQGPCCHDGLSARLIERAGFPFAFMSGFCVSAARLGAPDAGLISFAEMVDQVDHCWSRKDASGVSQNCLPGQYIIRSVASIRRDSAWKAQRRCRSSATATQAMATLSTSSALCERTPPPGWPASSSVSALLVRLTCSTERQHLGCHVAWSGSFGREDTHACTYCAVLLVATSILRNVNAGCALTRDARHFQNPFCAEDQVAPKSCGHVRGKRVVPREEAVARIRAAVDAR